jgi:hypothetical protein
MSISAKVILEPVSKVGAGETAHRYLFGHFGRLNLFAILLPGVALPNQMPNAFDCH